MENVKIRDRKLMAWHAAKCYFDTAMMTSVPVQTSIIDPNTGEVSRLMRRIPLILSPKNVSRVTIPIVEQLLYRESLKSSPLIGVE